MASTLHREHLRPSIGATQVRGVASRFLITVLIGLFATAVLAHPFHITSGEAQLDRDRQLIEVSIELNPTELQQAIELSFGQRIDLDRPDAEAHVAKYCARAFSIKLNDQEAELHWVGMELELVTGWLHFELRGIKALSDAKVSNRFLVEVADFGDSQQLNTMRFRAKTGKYSEQWHSVSFTAPNYEQVLDFDAASVD